MFGDSQVDFNANGKISGDYLHDYDRAKHFEEFKCMINRVRKGRAEDSDYLRPLVILYDQNNDLINDLRASPELKEHISELPEYTESEYTKFFKKVAKAN